MTGLKAERRRCHVVTRRLRVLFLKLQCVSGRFGCQRMIEIVSNNVSLTRRAPQASKDDEIIDDGLHVRLATYLEVLQYMPSTIGLICRRCRCYEVQVASPKCSAVQAQHHRTSPFQLIISQEYSLISTLFFKNRI